MTELPRPSDSKSRAKSRLLDLARRKSVREAAWGTGVGGCPGVKLEGEKPRNQQREQVWDIWLSSVGQKWGIKKENKRLSSQKGQRTVKGSLF